MASNRRPEHKAPPEIFYNEDEARKYTSNSRMIEIQSQMSARAIELLALPEDAEGCLILDLGCGSGLSGEVIEEQNHVWIGVDISQWMLNVALERDIENGDLVLGDLGQGLPFRAGSFDGAISISALQWLCNADKKSHNPVKRLYILFSTLYACLSRGSRAVFQFYPENSSQAELITQQAMRAGFTGGIVVDYPNSTKAKKWFLVLFTGGSNNQLPKGLTNEREETSSVSYSNTTQRDASKRYKNLKGKPLKKSKEWILQKKERRRRQGKEVRPDSKYTARRRCGRF
ncbi:putative 18S rRNA (guanine-N(7))-methyltransferase-like isoform X1 [Dinothrombium tinctorium]|uniref:18S rRNA (guanine-N(7))-methyltransferase n=1 Tax=Dinothrombium tinctorium TaxID=1965070 RepID=A0A3S3PFW2_9ACAR|nr:putative 18S rRNA (guanine-N(7))-methyltransferase-like isoform X1 [Dinothrombium tinctorium]